MTGVQTCALPISKEKISTLSNIQSYELSNPKRYNELELQIKNEETKLRSIEEKLIKKCG